MSEPIEEAGDENQKKEDNFDSEFAVINMTGHFEIFGKKGE